MKLSAQDTQQNQVLFYSSLTASTGIGFNVNPLAEIDTRSMNNFFLWYNYAFPLDVMLSLAWKRDIEIVKLSKNSL